MVKRVLQVTAPGQFDIVERPIDPPGEGQVAVEIEAVTTCPQWDMHLWRGEPMFPRAGWVVPDVLELISVWVAGAAATALLISVFLAWKYRKARRVRRHMERLARVL